METELDRWKREQARAYLESVLTAGRRMQTLQRNMDELRRQVEDVKAVDYSSSAASCAAHDTSGRMSEYIDRMDSMIAVWTLRVEEWTSTVQEASALVLALDDPEESAALMDYYVTRRGSWRMIAEEHGYSYDGMTAVKRRALRNLYDLMPQKLKDSVPGAI